MKSEEQLTNQINAWKVYQITELFYSKEFPVKNNSIFDFLSEPKTLEQVIDNYELCHDSTRRFFNCWNFLGIIKKQDEKYQRITPRPEIGSKDAESLIDVDSSNPDLDPGIRTRIIYFQKAIYPFTTLEALWNALKYGQSQWKTSLGVGVNEVFELYNGDSQLPELFARSFANLNEKPDEKMIETLPWKAGLSVLDVGGGTGQLCRRIYKKHPDVLQIINYETEAGSKTILPLFNELNPDPDKLKIIFGNFFKKTENDYLYNLTKTDTFDYIFLCWILHDWDDAKCIEILKRTAKHLNDKGKIIISELFLDENGLGRATIPDVLMLTMANGLERRISEYGSLLASAGLEIESVENPPQSRGFIVAVKKSDK